MDWTCPICGQPNLAEHKDCVNCGCAVNAMKEQIDVLRNDYNGEIFSAEVKDSVALSEEMFSSIWWDAAADRYSSTALPFWIWFFFGVLTIGLTGRRDAWTIVGGGCAIGFIAAFRCSLNFSDAGYGGTRKKVVLTNVALAVTVLTFTLWKFA